MFRVLLQMSMDSWSGRRSASLPASRPGDRRT